MKTLCILLIKFYRKFISPLKPPCCRFTPTCSAYALEAFAEWGFFRGFFLSLMRILRCNPFCRGGYDPVPANPKKRKNKNSPTNTKN
ncbi:MAG: membrane protein insertion efficiency factor YidD [Clostridia bacterium]|nr:membrane protein insertion efficiency factor YidD [Clostridia bacterium]